MAYIDAFRANKELVDKLGESNAHLIWVLGMLLQESDLEALASASLTDGSDDKKIDLLHLDRDGGRIILAQGYFSKTSKDTAPANKASDLNTAAAWLFSGDLSIVPKQLHASISDCREALEEGEISSVDVFYVHNLPESINVNRELQTVANHFREFLRDLPTITVTVKELGAPSIEHLFASQESHIEVTDEIICPSKVIFNETGPGWEAGVMSVPGSWLHSLYTKYDEALFSANYRGFLGFSKRRKINTAIRATAETSPEDFWVYNNGITLVTLGLSEIRDGTRLTGISIINGAQTTGSIGNVDVTKHDIKKVRVLCRVIICQGPEKIGNIIKYNNTQNEITTWDQYSSDPEQVRIQQEFEQLGYVYERKRGFRPRADAIGIEDVAQPLVAFQGRYSEANRGRNRIFERNQVYKQAFDGKKARHILLVYTLARAIDERRIELKKKSSEGRIIGLEEHQLLLLRNLRFKFFLLAVLAGCLEPLLGFKVDLATVAYSPNAANASKRTFISLIAECLPVVTSVLTLFCTQVKPDNLSDWMTRDKAVDTLSQMISAILYSTQSANQFAGWRELIVAS